MSDKRLPIVKDTTGLSLFYRALWRLQFVGFFFFGPAELPPHRDPKEALKRGRAQRVLRAHEAAGTQAPDEVIETAKR
ncbi:hypothetical protein ACIGB6_12605 [Paeniglutamicibacter gangotriensis]|uniref:Uncharacterized protein n=1 Tax=Paeniglutamicibacter gangotriensis TaxID=254787 RepID=A0A5B0EK58_9MICC|nr:hypothetical protein [Paeniglutamicibacter gangotriensis]KAA0979394.1 hypothetical protein FQ154_02935 [Paeniglutamicibacter gangotriensis]